MLNNFIAGHGRSPSANVMYLRNEGTEHLRTWGAGALPLPQLVVYLNSNEEKMTNKRIIYTVIDEAPALATFSLLPILQSFTKGSGITFDKKDISLARRILAIFP